MATPYQISISMNPNTVNALTDGGFSLYGFKGAQTTMKGGMPLVWFQSQKFSLSTIVTWQEQFQGYTSQSAIVPNGGITASASYDMDLGQTLNVTSSAGIGNVTSGGTQNALSISNNTTSPFTCGISQMSGSGSAAVATPICAFPLYGNGLDVFAPIELVLLSFATTPMNTGTVIAQSFTQACLINLTTESEMSVSYDINTGWDGAGSPNVQLYPAGTSLVPLLLQSSPSLARRVLAASNVPAHPAAKPQHPQDSRGNGALIHA